jgi:hypothetical protein
MAGLIDIGIGNLFKEFMPVVNRVLDFIPDPVAKEKARVDIQNRLIEVATQESNNQAEINKIEAGNSNIFVSGWRPAIGWVCATSFAWIYVGHPIAQWLCTLFGVSVGLPTPSSSNLLELTYAMLGLGALSSFDKWKGTSK